MLQHARHKLNRPRYYPGTTCVYDCDDADILEPERTDAVIECCRDSSAVIAGSRFLAGQFRPHNPNVSVVWTGSYIQPVARRRPSEDRDRVVAWAASCPLEYPVEAEWVAHVMARLAERVRFTFRLYGAKPGQEAQLAALLRPIRDKGVHVELFELMPYRRFVRTLDAVAVGLHPVCIRNPFSQGKSFGKLLAYLAADVAIVTSSEVDHPLFFEDGRNGMLVSEDVETWVDRCERLLLDTESRGRMVAEAHNDYLRRLTTGAGKSGRSATR